MTTSGKASIAILIGLCCLAAGCRSLPPLEIRGAASVDACDYLWAAVMFKDAALEAKTDTDRREMERQAELLYGAWHRPWLYHWPEPVRVPPDESQHRDQERTTAFRGWLNGKPDPPYREDMQRAIQLLTPEEGPGE